MPPWLVNEPRPVWQTWYDSPNRDAAGTPCLRVSRGLPGGWFRSRYADGTEFLIDAAGSEIWSTWPTGSTIEDAAAYLLGPIFGFALRLRGTPCLHASAVRVRSAAVALMGPGGAGKSTMAAVLARLGAAVVTEDVLPLTDREGRWFVEPG